MKLRALVFLLLLLCLVPQQVGASAPLKIGDKGWKVKIVQMKLNIIGMRTAETGNFSEDLEQMVKNFQRSKGLKVNGQIDDKTYQSIIDEAFAREGIRGVSPFAIIRTAAMYKGVPYSFGGSTPKGFDCSGYVQYVFKKNSAVLPRTADVQLLKGIFVTQRSLRPGDLVFFTTYEPGASHVGIYAGNGKFWNATSSQGVTLSSLNDTYWHTRYFGGRRVLVEGNK